MKLNVVVYQIGGYAREDAPQMRVAAVLTDPERAAVLRRMVQGEVIEMEVDAIPAGYLENAKQMGLPL